MASQRPFDVLAALPLTATAASILVGVILFGCLLNVKNLPLMWHTRLISAVLYHSRFKQSESIRPDGESGVPAIFCPIVMQSRSPLYECDINIHKSDSTYFSDLDISRFHLLAKLFKGIFNHSLYQAARAEKISLALAGTCCIFRREIKPYAVFEVHSRVLSWDHKWLYIISHFVEPGSYQKFRDGRATLDEHANENSASPSEKKSAWNQEQCRRAVYASAISQYVFKEGRKTVEPDVVLKMSGLIPHGQEEGAANGDECLRDRIEDRRISGLATAERLLALHEMHDLFAEGTSFPSLGMYGLLGQQHL